MVKKCLIKYPLNRINFFFNHLLMKKRLKGYELPSCPFNLMISVLFYPNALIE